MNKKIRRLLALLCGICLSVTVAAAAQAQTPDYGAMSLALVSAQRAQLTGGGSLLSQQELLPAGQSPVADWYALAMARAGIADDYEAYLSALKAYVERCYASGGLSANKATEYHRIALAVTALGGDASAFGTDPGGAPIDLLADGCWNCVIDGGPGAQGLNGWIFALLALDAAGCEVPADAPYGRDVILNAIVSAQGDDGGFSLGGGETDADITAMALQALAPYAPEYSGVIDRALAALSAAQSDDGGFASWGTENAESCAQVVMALCALGIDPAADERFVKPGGSAVSALLRFRMEDGSFAHVGNTSDPMASEQALQALESLRRFYAGEARFFDMTDAGSVPQTDGQGGVSEEKPAGALSAAYYIVPCAVIAAVVLWLMLRKKGRNDHE